MSVALRQACNVNKISAPFGVIWEHNIMSPLGPSLQQKQKSSHVPRLHT